MATKEVEKSNQHLYPQLCTKWLHEAVHKL